MQGKADDMIGVVRPVHRCALRHVLADLRITGTRRVRHESHMALKSWRGCVCVAATGRSRDGSRGAGAPARAAGLVCTPRNAQREPSQRDLAHFCDPERVLTPDVLKGQDLSTQKRIGSGLKEVSA